MRRWLFLLPLLSAPGAGAHPPLTSSVPARTIDLVAPTTRLDAMDAYVSRAWRASGIPGLAIVVLERGRVTALRAYGDADRAGARPMTTRTPIVVGSTTKGLTALAVMQLVEAGAVRLDERVARYLPSFALHDPRAASITVRHLLTHTSGLPSGDEWSGARDDGALERRVRALRSVKLRFAPGEAYEYTNDGYTVLGRLVEVASGQAYEAYVARRVFAPIGMTASTFDPARARAEGLATGYVRQRGRVVPFPLRHGRALYPTGAWIATAEDVGRYLETLLGGGVTPDGTRVLTEASLRQMWTPAPDSEYGLGWGVLDVNGARVVTHTGRIGTHGSFFALDPERGVGVAILVNHPSAAMTAIGQGVFALLHGETPPPVRPDPPPATMPAVLEAPDRTRWARFEGVYALGTMTVRVDVRGERLLGRAASPGHPFVFELRPVGEAEFVAVNLGAASELDARAWTFRALPDGRVDVLLDGTLAGTRTAPREGPTSPRR